MAPTDVARVIPSRTSPDPAKLVKWTDKPTGCLSIAAWVAVAYVLQEFCVTRRMDWTGETSWISETSWRAGSIALAGGVCLGLALVHYTDPGVIKPNPHGVDPAVAEYLSMGRPVYVKRLRSDGTDPNDDTDDTDDTDSDDRRRRRRMKKFIALAVRYAKDWRGQPIRSIFPAAFLHHEDPEGPCLYDGRTPEFDARCVTNTYCTTCDVWRPPRASHCRQCGYCMERFDHHCPVLGTCIAAKNMRWFATFLMYAGLACASYAAASVVRITQVCDASIGDGAECTKGWELWVLLVYSLFLTWGGLTLLPFGVSTLCWLCMDVTTKERLGAKPLIGTRHRVNTRMKRIKKKSGLGDETDADGDGASPRQVWVGEGEGGNDTDDTEDESTLMGMGSAAFIPGYPPPHPDLIWWWDNGKPGPDGKPCVEVEKSGWREVLCVPVRLRPRYDKHDVAAAMKPEFRQML